MTKDPGAPQVRYLTTSIPYVNAPPHLGFALEVVQADCLARHYRLQGHEVRFQSGTDENSLKNVQAAEALGVPVEALVRENATRFSELEPTLDLSYDDFIRTSCDPRHRVGVERLWRACDAAGDIYRRAYSGLYCTGCEQFYKASDLEDGRCPEHGTAPEPVSEENWFFRLSHYGERLRRALTSGELQVVPESRRNEVLAQIDDGLEDFSISRSALRARGWGLPVPGDPDQVIYVWFDALANYISALDYGCEGAAFERFWRGSASREHVIGKGISRFHALYWPAILLSAGLALPTRIFVHGYVTVDGRKIGKSTGNTVDPVPLAEGFGADAVRYYLLRHLRSTEDGDFSHARFEQAYASELSGQLGNLVHRMASMIARYCGGVVPAAPARSAPPAVLAQAGRLQRTVSERVEAYAFHEALAAIWSVVAGLNRHVNDCAPWELAKHRSDPQASEALGACLADSAQALVLIACALAPLLPTTSARMLAQFGLGRKIEQGPLLFPMRANPRRARSRRPAASRRGCG